VGRFASTFRLRLAGRSFTVSFDDSAFIKRRELYLLGVHLCTENASAAGASNEVHDSAAIIRLGKPPAGNLFCACLIYSLLTIYNLRAEACWLLADTDLTNCAVCVHVMLDFWLMADG
jgi:hypothetical protein